MTKSKKSSSLMSYAGTFGALVILCVVLAIASPNFFKYSNMMSVLKQTSFNALVSTGMLLCLITAGIDLSVGANATFAACLAGMLVNKGMNNPVLLLVVAIVGGTLIGWINGMLLTRLHLPHPFVSTLGMKNVLWGGALIITNSQMVSFSGNDAVMWLGSSTVAGFPVSFIVVLVIYVIMHILLTKTALGRSIYCVGGNPEAARLSGINSANVLTFCYTLSGFMAALAGIVSIGRSGICNGVNAIQPYDTDAIAACIIGGASFMGGKGTMVGTMLGALIIAVLRNGFSLLSVSSAVQNLVLGLVIIGAVLLDVTRERMAAKASVRAYQTKKSRCKAALFCCVNRYLIIKVLGMGANLWLGDQKDRHLRFARRPLNLVPAPCADKMSTILLGLHLPLFLSLAQIRDRRPLRYGEQQSGYHCVSFANYSQFTDSVLLHMRVILHRRDIR